MPEQLISASGTQHGLIIDGFGRVHTRGFRDSVGNGRRMLVDSNRHGQVSLVEEVPTAPNKNNPAWKLEYDPQNNLGSVTEFIGAGSYVNVLTWAGFSGTSIGIGSNVTNIGSFY